MTKRKIGLKGILSIIKIHYKRLLGTIILFLSPIFTIFLMMITGVHSNTEAFYTIVSFYLIPLVFGIPISISFYLKVLTFIRLYQYGEIRKAKISSIYREKNHFQIFQSTSYFKIKYLYNISSGKQLITRGVSCDYEYLINKTKDSELDILVMGDDEIKSCVFPYETSKKYNWAM